MVRFERQDLRSRIARDSGQIGRHCRSGERQRCGQKAAVHDEDHCPSPSEVISEISAIAIRCASAGGEKARFSLAGTAVEAQSITDPEEHTSELQSLMRISYAVFCLKKKNNYKRNIR